MKKILSMLGAIGLTATSTTTLISCEKPNNSENEGDNKPEQPAENSNGKVVNDYNGLKNNSDNKYYFVIGKQYNMKKGQIMKFKHDKPYNMGIEFYIKNNRFKGLYRGDGTGEPETHQIDTNIGKILKG